MWGVWHRGQKKIADFPAAKPVCTIAIDAILSDMRPSLGKGVPLTWLSADPGNHKSRNAGDSVQLQPHSVYP